MLVEKPEETLGKISDSLEGTPYILRIDDPCLTQPGSAAIVYQRRGPVIIYPSASIMIGRDGELKARRCAVADPIPKDLKKLLEKAGLKVKDVLI